MKSTKIKRRIALIGGGPAALFMYKTLINTNRNSFEIDIYERKSHLGMGMPYSIEGANKEHVTNVSDNEIPPLPESVNEWLKSVPEQTLKQFKIVPEKFNEYKVFPRLLFGKYLSAQFNKLIEKAAKNKIKTNVRLNCNVCDIADQPEQQEVWVYVDKATIIKYDYVIICSGHNWPKQHEGTIPQYFDSPYPPSKLALALNHPVAIKGSSLTAIDAIRTLARSNGIFKTDKNGRLSYQANKHSKAFRIVMHSRAGLLPAVRFHLDDSHLSKDSILSTNEVAENMKKNGGFLMLDFVFEKNFKEAFREKQPAFYERIKDMRIEDFVEDMMSLRERLDAFTLLKAEYAEAEKSIQRKESVYWKEMLAVLSYALNYPAKHFSAEDMLRLQKVLMPLISVVIAFVPQSSCKELLALHDAGLLDIIAVTEDSYVEPGTKNGATYYYADEANSQQSVSYETFVDCAGQPRLSYDDVPFKSLISKKTISSALIKFKSKQHGRSALKHGNKDVLQDNNGDYYLKVAGITINDNFQVVNENSIPNQRIFMMAVPYIGGYNPDYSGLDFCEAASARIIECIN